MEANDEAGKHLNNQKGEDAIINFRSSRNFKYMKKYIKGKVPAEDKLSGASGDVGEAVVAPLPRDSPPPLPPPLVVPIKMEDKSMSTPKHINETVMCRQFVRGDCKRGDTCAYAHKIILSQLHNVYTFCRNFQNAKCSLKRCNFTHATIFEQEHFYRTGVLPPHARAHIEQSADPARPSTSLRPVEGVRELSWLDPTLSHCSKCVRTKFRFQSQLNEAKQLESSIQKLDNEIQLLDKKNAKQVAALLWLVEHSSAAVPGSQLYNNLSIKKDQEQAVMNYLNMIYVANSADPSAVEDNANKSPLTALVWPVLSRAEEVTLEYFLLTSNSEEAVAAPTDS